MGIVHEDGHRCFTIIPRERCCPVLVDCFLAKEMANVLFSSVIYYDFIIDRYISLLIVVAVVCFKINDEG